MKSSASESDKNGYLDLEQLSVSFRWPGSVTLSAMDRLWKGFVSDAEFFLCAEPTA